MGVDDKRQDTHFFIESMVNECLQYALGAETYQDTFERLLSFAGEYFQCARVYIFELNTNGTFSNTYEWCAPGNEPQKELLQYEPMETIDWWIASFQENRQVMIRDVEDIRDQYPSAYAALKPQGIRSLTVCPLRSGEKIIGFLGIDNPKQEQIPMISSFFQVIEHFVVSLLKRRDLSYRLSYISYHDQLTGALNRRAYKEKEKELQGNLCIGVLYSDITGLKRENDLLGHDAGDRLICRCYEMIHREFAGELIYRMGGDEFMAICVGIPCEEFQEKCGRLRKTISKEDCHLATGSSWGCLQEKPFHILVNEAEEEMYRNKKQYYSEADSAAGTSRGYGGRETRGLPVGKKYPDDAKTLREFLLKNPDSISTLVDSTEMPDSPISLYVGDLQTNVYYITDTMRDMFGFESNVVYDLLTKWEKRICHSEDLESYREDMKNIWENNGKEHNFKYRVYDKEGKMLWIHCMGMLCRDEKGAPGYFAGFVSRQEFMIDPVTNFPREKGAVNKLEMLREKGLGTIVFGIGLNHFMEINEMKGREMADRLLQDITMHWDNKLSNHVWFYRMDGVSFMVVVKPEYVDLVDGLLKELRESVYYYFRKWHIQMKTPCSICEFYYPADEEEPEKFVEKVITFIDVMKSYPENECVSYSAQTIEKYRESAGMTLCLSEDVLNGCRNLRIVIQPIVSAYEGKVEGGEVLLRWKYKGADIPPAVFIPILENKKLICQVGRWVFQETVRHCARIASNHPDFHLSFNVSYLQIRDRGLLSFMEETMKRYRIDGHNLIMELTETHFDDEPEMLMKFLNGCKDLGMSIALDDFGSGYSSMGLLIKYPSNVVKLDRSLLTNLIDSKDKQTFLKTMIFACHQLGKQVCTEGVEGSEEAQIVRETGSDMIQGYHFYRPLELADFYGILNEN